MQGHQKSFIQIETNRLISCEADEGCLVGQTQEGRACPPMDPASGLIRETPRGPVDHRNSSDEEIRGAISKLPGTMEKRYMYIILYIILYYIILYYIILYYIILYYIIFCKGGCHFARHLKRNLPDQIELPKEVTFRLDLRLSFHRHGLKKNSGSCTLLFGQRPIDDVR